MQQALLFHCHGKHSLFFLTSQAKDLQHHAHVPSHQLHSSYDGGIFRLPTFKTKQTQWTLPFSVYLYLEQTVIKHVQLTVSKSLSVVIMTREHFSAHNINFENEY